MLQSEGTRLNLLLRPRARELLASRSLVLVKHHVDWCSDHRHHVQPIFVQSSLRPRVLQSASIERCHHLGVPLSSAECRLLLPPQYW